MTLDARMHRSYQARCSRDVDRRVLLAHFHQHHSCRQRNFHICLDRCQQTSHPRRLSGSSHNQYELCAPTASGWLMWFWGHPCLFGNHPWYPVQDFWKAVVTVFVKPQHCSTTHLISRYQRSSIICVKLTPSVKAQATFCPTPGGCWNLLVVLCELFSWKILGNPRPPG